MSSAAVVDLTESSFGESVAGSDGAVLVEFWAEWCPPCRAMAPVLHALAADLDDRLRVYTVNADENPGLTRQFHVAAVPTLLLFHEGELVRTMTGARSRAQLLADLEDVLSP